MNDHAKKVAADYAAGLSVPAWLVSWFADTLPMVQWLSGFFAIVGVCFAMFVKWQEWKKLRSKA